MHDDRAKNQPNNAPFRLGDWEVDPAYGTISRGEERVRLEPKVMDVLVYLAGGGNSVVSKDRIFEAVWADAVVEEAALSRCISELRRGLGDDARDPRYIETIPKRGYRVIAEVTDLAGATLGSAAGARRGEFSRWQLAVPWILVAVMAAILLAASLGRRLVVPVESGPIKSLAVLPVQNLSGDPDQNYFAEGITDGLITELGQIAALGKVTSRASVGFYADGDVPLREIGERLGVDGLIEGSVLSVSDVVRMNVRLFHASSDTQVWSGSFEGEPHDIGALYGEIAEAIARQIRIELTAQERARIDSSRPVDPEAHTAYLQGRHFWNERTEEGFRRAQEYFERALEIDPDYAAAHAGLADNYFLSEMPSRMESTRLAREELARALELDDSLAAAHASLGFVLVFDWQWAAAEKEFQRAIELNPSYATAHHWYGLSLSWAGRHDEALEEVTRAVEIDPLSPILLVAAGTVWSRAGDPERGVELFRDALELDPSFLAAHLSLAKSSLALGRPDAAVAAFESVAELSSAEAALATVGIGYAAAGRRADAEAILTRLDEFDAETWRAESLAFHVAGIHAQLGNNERAFQYLEQAYAEGEAELVTIRVEEALAPVRADPRFDDLMQRMGLPPAG